MVKFTPEEIASRTAEAQYKKAVSSITGIKKYDNEAELDMRFIEVMKKVIEDQKVNLNDFLR